MTIASKNTKYEEGPFPFPQPIKWINSISRKYAQRPFDASTLIETSKNTTSLSDFGSEFWRVSLEKLITDINKHTQFHAIGAFSYRQKILSNLRNRLWATHWCKKYPEILSAPAPPILLITGLQRTGTTFFQRLLGEMPEFRGLSAGELISPVATNKRGKGMHKSLAKLALFLFNQVNPYFRTIHSVDYDSLEEEVILMDHSFMSSATEAVLNVPEYGLWLEKQDHTPAYLDLKMWLKLILWRNPADQYLLQKSPHHMEFLESYRKVFPKSKAVIIHRPVEESLASFCSMVYFGKMNFLQSTNPVQIGRKWLRKNKVLIDRFLEAKRRNPDYFIEFSYHSLVNDPTQLLRVLYQKIDLNWTFEHERRANRYINLFHQNKYGKHGYKLSDFGLSRSQVRDYFEEYIDEYQSLIYPKFSTGKADISTRLSQIHGSLRRGYEST